MPAKTPGRRADRPGPGGAGRRQSSALSILRRLSRYVRPHLGLFLATAAAAVGAAIFELLPPLVIRMVVDRALTGGDSGLIWLWAAGLLGISILQGGVDFVRLYLTAVVGQKVVFRIRNSLFEHLNRLSFSFYDRARTGDIMSRVTADTEVLSQLFGRAGVIVLTNMLFLLGVMVVLFTWSWLLGLAYAAMIPVMVMAVRIYAMRVRPAMGRLRRSLGALGDTLHGTLTGIEVVKILGRERLEEKRFQASSRRYMGAGMSAVRVQSLWMPFVNVLMGVGMAIVLWLGGYGAMRGAVSLGTLVAFAAYTGMLLRPVRQTGMMMNVVVRSLAAAERIFEVLDTRPEIRDAPGARPLPPVEGRISFEHVWFGYDSEKPVLRDICLEALPGELVALVGPSGAGKSTLVHLIPRFYDADRGRILIDGHDLREVTVESLRGQVGVALQDVFLFDTSIRENIAYGSPGVSDGEIERAAADVRIHDFVTSLPMGYGTPVGERGVRLSGGQRQRIALARVLLRNPRVLILDEPTSSVDADTERRMQEAFERVRRGRTTFVIAHRLWTVQHADRIIVLDRGRVVERGTGGSGASAHRELIRSGGLYSRLYGLQFGGEVRP